MSSHSGAARRASGALAVLVALGGLVWLAARWGPGEGRPDATVSSDSAADVGGPTLAGSVVTEDAQNAPGPFARRAGPLGVDAILRDSLDASPVVGARVSIDGTLVGISDARGAIHLPRDSVAVKALEVVGWWVLQPWRSLSADSDHEVWLARSAPLTGTVRFDTGGDSPPKRNGSWPVVRLSVHAPAAGVADPRSEAAQPLMTWRDARSHGADALPLDVRWDGKSDPLAFDVEVPRGPGWVLRAESIGFAPSWVEIDSGAASASPVELLLVRNVRIEGQVTDSRGNPIRGAEVRAYVTVRGKPEEVSTEVLALYGRSATAAKGDGWEETTVISASSTDENGKYLIESPIGGATEIVVRADGFDVQRTEPLEPEAVIRPDPHVLSDAPVDGVRLLRDGVELAQWRVGVADMSRASKGRPGAQPMFEYVADASGRLPPGALVRGRTYSLVLKPPAGLSREAKRLLPRLDLRWLPYGGEDEVNVATLSTDVRPR